jgi:hypothetical protein
MKNNIAKYKLGQFKIMIVRNMPNLDNDPVVIRKGERLRDLFRKSGFPNGISHEMLDKALLEAKKG